MEKMILKTVILIGFILYSIKLGLVVDAINHFTLNKKGSQNDSPNFKEFISEILVIHKQANKKLKSEEYKKERPIGYLLNTYLVLFSIGLGLIILIGGLLTV